MHTPVGIKSKANDLLTKSKIVTAPIDVARIAELSGLTIRYEELEDAVSGFLMAKGSSGTVFINKLHHPNRQRFTIAHEIGHYALHFQNSERLFYDTKFPLYRRTGATTNSTTTPQEEREANSFASHLLMPDNILKTVIAERIDLIGDESDIAMLASLFQVSEIAMSIRLEKYKWS